MTCNDCKHAKRIGPVLCCLHPRLEKREIGPYAASVVLRSLCDGSWAEKR